MPAGKYSFYLHTDDRTDVAAMATLASISQPLRGDFIRTAAIAGCVVYRVDARLPELVTALFDGQLGTDQLCGLLAVVSGEYSLIHTQENRTIPVITGPVTEANVDGERRRFTLLLPDAQSAQQVEPLLDGAVSRLRGQLLRSVIVTGLALHTLDTRLPRLLASLPVPPATVRELHAIIAQVADIPVPVTAPVKVEAEPLTDRPEDDDKTTIIKNMKRMF